MPGSSVTRREVLKRGAVVGGVVWAAPVIQSLTHAAHAQGSPLPCSNYATRVFRSPQSCAELPSPNDTSQCLTRPGDAINGGCTRLAITSSTTDNRLLVVQLAEGCQFVEGRVRCNGCDPTNSSVTASPDGRTVTAICPSGSTGNLTHAELVFCCVS